VERIRWGSSVSGRVLEYGLDLDIDFPAKSFRGSVEISGLTDPGPVRLDSIDLEVARVRLGDTDVPFRTDPATKTLVVERGVEEGQTLRIEFSGRAAQGPQTGLFVSRLESVPALSTQMEPESCRRLFPCFDRPDRKAVFRVQVTTQPDLVVISNMPGRKVADGDAPARWRFDPTPPMSSYLLYLGIGPFEETTDTDGPFPIVVAGPPGKRGPAQRTASLARTVLRGYSDYFDLPYPLPKLHFIAISDFWAGMENWGAISGGVDQYLLDESASPISLLFADETITHEIAHQWFGNLVTLTSWDDLWLNEAFAQFAVPLVQEFTGLRRDPWGEFVTVTQSGLRLDSLPATHPVKPESVDASEIIARADEITYLKGARLIRMVQGFVGADSFRDGITEYLRDHQLGNATSDDLWDALEEESQLPVTRVMRTWVERAGHPCVTIRQVGPDVELTQHRYNLIRQGPDGPPWPIPLTIAEGESRESIVFDREQTVLRGRNAERLTLDPGRSGFFRVLWDRELRPAVIRKLRDASGFDQAGFVQDAESFLISGDYSVDDFVAILEALTPATERVAVEATARALEVIDPILPDDRHFREAACSFLRTQIERLGERPVRGEAEGLDVARDILFWMRVRMDPAFSKGLGSRIDTVASEPPPVRRAILTGYAREGGVPALDRLLAMACGNDADLSWQASFAVAETAEPARLLRSIESDLGAIPAASLYAYLLPTVARIPDSRAIEWEWLQRHARTLEERAKGTPLLSTLLSRTIPRIGMGRAESIRAYFGREQFDGARTGIERGLELLDAYEQFRNHERESGGA
jgi:tricorn protease interacting factor F2/3